MSEGTSPATAQAKEMEDLLTGEEMSAVVAGLGEATASEGNSQISCTRIHLMELC